MIFIYIITLLKSWTGELQEFKEWILIFSLLEFLVGKVDGDSNPFLLFEILMCWPLLHCDQLKRVGKPWLIVLMIINPSE